MPPRAHTHAHTHSLSYLGSTVRHDVTMHAHTRIHTHPLSYLGSTVRHDVTTRAHTRTHTHTLLPRQHGLSRCHHARAHTRTHTHTNSLSYLGSTVRRDVTTRAHTHAHTHTHSYLGSTVGHDVTPDTVHVQLTADLADLDTEVVRHIHLCVYMCVCMRQGCSVRFSGSKGSIKCVKVRKPSNCSKGSMCNFGKGTPGLLQPPQNFHNSMRCLQINDGKRKGFKPGPTGHRGGADDTGSRAGHHVACPRTGTTQHRVSSSKSSRMGGSGHHAA